jgi:hypothetical protein
MLLPFWVFIVIVVIAAIVILAARSRVRHESDKQVTLQQPEIDTLEYRVPEGQDPALLVSALQKEGYSAVGDTIAGMPRVVIDCPTGRDRERPRVRSVVKSANSTGFEGAEMEIDDVVFEDER